MHALCWLICIHAAKQHCKLMADIGSNREFISLSRDEEWAHSTRSVGFQTGNPFGDLPSDVTNISSGLNATKLLFLSAKLHLGKLECSWWVHSMCLSPYPVSKVCLIVWLFEHINHRNPIRCIQVSYINSNYSLRRKPVREQKQYVHLSCARNLGRILVLQRGLFLNWSVRCDTF